MATLQVRDWLDDFLTNVATFVNDSATGLGTFLSMIVLEWRDWIYDLLTKLGQWASDWATAVGDFLAHLVLMVTRFINAIIVAYALTITGWISALAVFLGLIDQALQGLIGAVNMVFYLVDLIGGLITGMKGAINSDSVAELYRDAPGLMYFWRGIEFFEDTAGASPLVYLNLVAIGFIGYNLVLWSIGQVADLMEDIARF